MRMYFITFRSVTPAQRAQRLLKEAGIACTLQRTPRQMQDRGCGYCLRLRSWEAPAAAALLRESGAAFSKIYVTENGRTEEVEL